MKAVILAGEMQESIALKKTRPLKRICNHNFRADTLVVIFQSLHDLFPKKNNSSSAQL